MAYAMVPVVSTSLAAVGYEQSAGILDIRFHHGGRYVYKSVPPAVYDELLAAASKGRYFHARIRDRYRFVRG